MRVGSGTSGEQAFSNKAAGFEPTPERQRMFGYGNFELTIGTIEQLLEGRTFICGESFTAVDLYVAAQLGFMMMFGMLEPRPAISTYVARCTDRDAYRRAKQIDEEAAAQLKAAGTQ